MNEVQNGKIHAVIPMIMSEIGAIGKNQRNSMQGYKFRGIDDIYNAMQPALVNNGCHFVPNVLEYTREERQTAKGQNLIYSVVKVEYRLYADDGSYTSAVVMGEAMDSGDKSMNKAMSAALKYAAFQLFCIPTEEMIDSERDTPVPDGDSLVPKGSNIVRTDTVPPIPAPVCVDCGKPVIPVKMPDGTTYTAADIVKKSVQKYGRNLCFNCCCAAKKNPA